MFENNIKYRKDFLMFGSPSIEKPEIEEVMDSLKSGWIGTGPKVARFEEEFKKYKDVSNCVAVNSCTAALHLSMISLNLQSGDEVITTPMTFCATINAIIHVGATPVLVDIDPITMNIDPNQIEAKITSKTKAILPVHFAGRPCEMDQICNLAKKHDLTIIEDCAHAIESEYHGQKIGTFGDFGCFSFYVTKNVITGEGGMVIAKNERDASRIKTLALHGMNKDAWKRFSDEGFKHYHVKEAGFKYNMMDIQAAIGIHQLKRVDKYWILRKQIWERYNAVFSKLPIILPAEVDSNTRHAYHLYTILIDKRESKINRDEFINAMHSRNIGTGVHYMSMPEHPYYQKKFGWIPNDYPNAMKIGQQTVSLPLSPKLEEDDVEDVINSVRDVFSSTKS